MQRQIQDLRVEQNFDKPFQIEDLGACCTAMSDAIVSMASESTTLKKYKAPTKNKDKEQPAKNTGYLAQQGTGKGAEREGRSSAQRAPETLRGTWQKGECWFYFNSTAGCTRGKDCKFSHAKLEETAKDKPRKNKGAGKGAQHGKDGAPPTSGGDAKN